MSKIVAIHQPNFLPWLGFFNKVALSDVFILLDNVQFPKTGGTWTNRVRIMVSGNPAWITVPVVRNYHGVRLIKDMEINNETPWRTRTLKTIEMNYKKHPFFDDEWPFVKDLISHETVSLCAFNIHAISTLAGRLNLGTSKLVVGSILEAQGKGTDLLISLTQSVNATTYLCGDGASEYQEDHLFAEAGLNLEHHNFTHPVYPQKTPQFTPGLSVIDALFSVGTESARHLLRNG